MSAVEVPGLEFGMNVIEEINNILDKGDYHPRLSGKTTGITIKSYPYQHFNTYGIRLESGSGEKSKTAIAYYNRQVRVMYGKSSCFGKTESSNGTPRSSVTRPKNADEAMKYWGGDRIIESPITGRRAASEAAKVVIGFFLNIDYREL